MAGSHSKLISRFQSLINPAKTILEDESVIYRKKSVEETIKASIESNKTIIIGHGWGKPVIKLRGKTKDVGGNLFINIIYFSGIFALIIFIMICINIIKIILDFFKL